MSSSEIRHYAYERLRGKWGIAILVSLVAGFLGAIETSAPSFNFSISNSSGNTSSTQLANEQVVIFIIIFVVAFILIMASAIALSILVGHVVNVGYSSFLLNVVDENEHKFTDVFSGFRRYKSVVLVGLRTYITIFLWSLLFVIPGIIASYDYAIVPFLQVDHPEYSPKECMEKSKFIMNGNRWRLFCLEFSFIGWHFLAGFTCGVGNVWLTPYIQTARAVFYREITGDLKPLAVDDFETI